MDLTNLNPFKKKEEFSLSNDSLPSLSDIGSSPFSSTDNDLPSLGSSSDFSAPPTLGDNDSSQFSESNLTPSFAKPEPMVPKEEISMNTPNESHSARLNNAQMETTLAKVTLIDARLNSIESKLDILTKLILEEVSDDTKRKLKVDSMMSNFK